MGFPTIISDHLNNKKIKKQSIDAEPEMEEDQRC